jgi:cobalamin biosynthesis protein CobT
VLVRLCKQAKNVAVLAANGGLEAPSKTLNDIRQLGLMHGAAAAVPKAEANDDQDDNDNDNHQQQSDDDDDEEYGNRQQKQQDKWSSGRGGAGAAAAAAAEEDDGPDAAAAAPAAYKADTALNQLLALRRYDQKWMALMCRVFLDVSQMT